MQRLSIYSSKLTLYKETITQLLIPKLLKIPKETNLVDLGNTYPTYHGRQLYSQELYSQSSISSLFWQPHKALLHNVQTLNQQKSQ